MSEPTERELECWHKLEQLARTARTSMGPNEGFLELDADEVKQLLVELDYERYVR